MTNFGIGSIRQAATRMAQTARNSMGNLVSRVSTPGSGDGFDRQVSFVRQAFRPIMRAIDAHPQLALATCGAAFLAAGFATSGHSWATSFMIGLGGSLMGSPVGVALAKVQVARTRG